VVSVDAIVSFMQVADKVIAIMTIFSTIIQIFVIKTAICHIRRRTGDQWMHVFILSMTVADTLLTSIGYPIELLQRDENIASNPNESEAPIPRFINMTVHALCWIGLSISGFSLVLLNIEKLFLFKSPLRHPSIFTRARAISLAGLCWAGCAAFVAFAWATQTFHCVDQRCQTLAMFPEKTVVYLMFMFAYGVLPSFTSLVVSFYLLNLVAKHQKQMIEEQSLVNGTGKVELALPQKVRTFYFIFVTTIWTAFTLLPYRLISIYRSLYPDEQKPCLTIFIYWILMYLIYLNAIVNPLITVTVLPQYRFACFHGLGRRKSTMTDDRSLKVTNTEL